jgi:hypothetical protein
MPRWTLLVTAASLLQVGCVHEGELEPGWLDDGRPPQPEVLVERQITVTLEEGPSPPALPPSPRDKPAPDPVRFPMGAGYGSLSHVDVAACRGRGLQEGYFHVHATFSPDGYVVRASVESEAPPSPPALDCIAEVLRQAGVPRFDGTEATLSKTYFVATGGPAAPEQPAAPSPQWVQR